MNRQQRHYKDNIEKYTERNRTWVKNNPKSLMLINARKRAKKQGIECSITLDDFEYVEVCPIMKVPMIKGGRYAPSLDRRDCSKGYVPGNVWVISRLANTMKNDASVEELKRFNEWLNSLLS